MAGRSWDLPDWYAAPGKAERLLNWTAKTDLATGLKLTSEWIRSLEGLDSGATTKRDAGPRRRSISAIIACYKDEQAIPLMYRRLTDTFKKLDVDYEIIFVNDGSPDDCAGRILEISAHRPACPRDHAFAQFWLADGLPKRDGNVGHASLRPSRR